MNERRIFGSSLISLIAAAALIVCLLAAFGTRPLAESPLLGDLTGDGEIDMKDVLALRLYIVSPDEAVLLTVADINGDGEVNMKDVLRLRRFLAHLDEFLGGQPTEPTTMPTTGTTRRRRASISLRAAMSRLAFGGGG